MLAGFSIWSIITPALIASLVTFYFNIRAEKKRAERDFISKAFDAARDDVRRAVEAAIDYYPYAHDERTPLREAKLWMGERDVRHSISALIEFSHPAGESRSVLQRALDDFIDSLTGGSFKSAEATPDLDQARKISSAGAKLRSTISAARHLELAAAVKSDVFSRSSQAAIAYLTANMGPEPDQSGGENDDSPAQIS